MKQVVQGNATDVCANDPFETSLIGQNNAGNHAPWSFDFTSAFVYFMRVTSHCGNYQAKSLSLYQCMACILQKWKIMFFFVLARQRLTFKEVIRELFMDRDSQEEPDESGDDSDSFVPETVPEEEKRVSDGGERRWQTFRVHIYSCFPLIPPTLSPQHPKLTWAGESTPSLFTW